MSRMLSTLATIVTPHWLVSCVSSSSARAWLLARNAIAPPFRPQKVQCDLAPHQQPRAVSNSSTGRTSALTPLASRSRK